MRNPLADEMYSYLQEQTQEYFLTIIFGSYARGEAYSSSDIDVLIVDSRYSGWNHINTQDSPFKWPEHFQSLHLFICSKEEFNSRYQNGDETIHNIVQEGFSVNKPFGLIDYVDTLE